MSIKVGYLGPDASTFGYLAAKKFAATLKQEVELVPFDSHNLVGMASGRKEIDYGVVAVENVIDGMVSESLRIIDTVHGKYNISVNSEVTVPIEMFYMKKGDPAEKPTAVLSHEVGLKQCKTFLDRIRSSGIPVEQRPSTGLAAKEASEKDGLAALASAGAAELYGLSLIEPDSKTDNPNSQTRFWILNKDYGEKGGKSKTSFLINLDKDKPGGLWKSIGFFASRGISICVIHAIPIPGKTWEYTFLIEIQGHITDKNVSEAWDEWSDSGLTLNRPRFIGSYADAT